MNIFLFLYTELLVSRRLLWSKNDHDYPSPLIHDTSTFVLVDVFNIIVPPHKIFLIQKVTLYFIKLETLVSETFTESWNRCLNILNN